MVVGRTAKHLWEGCGGRLWREVVVRVASSTRPRPREGPYPREGVLKEVFTNNLDLPLPFTLTDVTKPLGTLVLGLRGPPKPDCKERQSTYHPSYLYSLKHSSLCMTILPPLEYVKLGPFTYQLPAPRANC